MPPVTVGLLVSRGRVPLGVLGPRVSREALEVWFSAQANPDQVSLCVGMDYRECVHLEQSGLGKAPNLRPNRGRGYRRLTGQPPQGEIASAPRARIRLSPTTSLEEGSVHPPPARAPCATPLHLSVVPS